MKKFKNLFIAALITLAIIFMIRDTKDVMAAVNHAIILWASRVFPVLFPFYIITALAVRYGIAHFFGEIFKPITALLFRTSPISGFVLVMSLLSGNPSSAVIISELTSQGSISKEEAAHLLKFSVFVNPLFCLGTIGIAYFHNLSLGIIILFSHVSSNLIIGISLRFQLKKPAFTRFSLKAAYAKMEEADIKNKAGFGEVMTKTLQNGINTMFLIAGFMIFYSVVIVMLNSSRLVEFSYPLVFAVFKIPYETYQLFFVGAFEMVIGIDQTVNANLPLRTTAVFVTMLISFGGLSIHSQIQSILHKVNIRYIPFLLARLAQGALSGICAYLLFPYLYKEHTGSVFYRYQYSPAEKAVLPFTLVLIVLSLFVLYKSKKKEA